MTNDPTQTLAPDSLGPTVTVGEILVEIVASKAGAGFREPIEFIGPFPSGAPAIFIDQCARMGGAAAIVGAVGDDDFGVVNTERLKRDGVDISAIAVSSDFPTGSAFVRYRKDGSRDFVYNIAKSAAARLEWTREVEALITRCGHIHVMGTVFASPAAWAITEHAIAVIKARGGTMSLDPNLRKELLTHGQTEEKFAALVDKADLLLPSGEELFLAAGVDTEQPAIKALFNHGVKEIAIKRGKDGSSAYHRSGAHAQCPGFLVDETDPTGAGDCFGGAYVACRRLGMPIERALEFGNAAGARNVTRLGPMEGAGTRAELEDFIARTARRS
ncbi:tagatose kinase [Mesorhizobium silamurunense]|uniref:tagatose kinase n=1 Tax=Mesorhizobium silamurunense TaxID=499528 RepID=UPI00177B6D67|nr:sugar kinase [Mesorhizobium silamurunense]